VNKAKLIKENAAKTQQINTLQFELEQQKFIVEKLQKMLFGASSERFKKPRRNAFESNGFICSRHTPGSTR
jgi:hypothetical protein